MTSVESIGVAFFLMAVVFFGLLCLWFSVRVFSFLISKLEKGLGDAADIKNSGQE